MKIAFLHGESVFNSELLEKLRAMLEQYELIEWIEDRRPPAFDFEVLLAMGKVDCAMLIEQPEFSFVQTASDGFESVNSEFDSEAATTVAKMKPVHSHNRGK